MSYTITLRVYQKNTNAYFHVVEKTVFINGTWSETNGGTHTLTMGNSGTSGMLRFASDNADGSKEYFMVAVGVHNHKRWCDIITGLNPGNTGVMINPQYYNGGERAYMREKTLDKYTVDPTGTSGSGRKLEIVYTIKDGNNLAANIIIW